jgi:hypothetical protein
MTKNDEYRDYHYPKREVLGVKNSARFSFVF